MSLLSNKKTIDEEIKSHKESVKRLLGMISSQYIFLGRQFWQNKNFTPEQMAEAYGEDAVELFELSKKLGALLTDVTSKEIKIVPDDYDIIPLGEGRIKIEKKPVK